MAKTEWIYIGSVYSMGIGYDEYISKDGKYGLQLWDDGSQEIFEIS